MQVDFSKYYTGTQDIPPNIREAYRGGVKIEQEKKEACQAFGELKEQYSDQTMLMISSDSVGKIIKKMQENGELEEKGFSEEELEIRREIIKKYYKAMTPQQRAEMNARIAIVRDDHSGILNHSYINGGTDHDKLFERYACGYAKYLNQDITTAYDDEIFYNCQDEELYRKGVKGAMRAYASNVLSYYAPNRSEKDEEALAYQLADAVIEYAKNIANGDWNISHVKSTITIKGADFTYAEFWKTQKMLEKVNLAGVSQIGSNYDTTLYMGLTSNYDTVAFAQLGLRTAQVKHYCDTQLNQNAAELVKSVWKERTEKTIENKFVKSMQSSMEFVQNNIQDYSEGLLDYLSDLSCYRGTIMEKTYDIFAGVEGTSKESFGVSFTNAITKYQKLLKQTGEKANGKQMKYLYSTEWITV